MENELLSQIHLIPLPASITPLTGTFTLQPDASIYTPEHSELRWIAQYLAEKLRSTTGYALPISNGAFKNGDILLLLHGDTTLGEEGYELAVSPDSVRIAAPTPAGIFWGVQTLRQLFPPTIECGTVQSSSWAIPAVTIRDTPRFAWRGMMLDVSRHFFPVEDIKHIIDLLSAYKLNRFHLHLSDDQGWRIEIESWARLATVGGASGIDGAGGYYTKRDYAEIVAYAQQRYITVVPEIDMPGHTNAALASYAELNCDDTARQPYTGIEVGFSSLCVDKAITYQFVDDVIRELAEMTPGAYIHIGGDEASSTPKPAYQRFVKRVQEIVHAHGKHMIGWEEVAQTDLDPTSIVQIWKEASHVQEALQKGARLIMSPAQHAYLDMKYNAESPLGLQWAGLVSVQHAYEWEPTQFGLPADAPESVILGVEAALWSETLRTRADIETMVLPRLLGHAEIAWSPRSDISTDNPNNGANRHWGEYKVRLGTHGRRLQNMGMKLFLSTDVPWA
jgi:hexosaminidase